MNLCSILLKLNSLNKVFNKINKTKKKKFKHNLQNNNK